MCFVLIDGRENEYSGNMYIGMYNVTVTGSKRKVNAIRRGNVEEPKSNGINCDSTLHGFLMNENILTALMGEDGLAHRARPHPEACAKLTGLRMAGQVLPKTTLVDVVFSTHWTRVVGGPSLR